MNILTGVVARVIFTIPFLGFGVRHLMHAGLLSGLVPIPGGVFWVYLTGVAMLLASFAAITGIQGRNAMLLLALMLFIFAFSVQFPAMLNPDPTMKVSGTVSFYKDLGLAGAALVLAGVFEKKKVAA